MSKNRVRWMMVMIAGGIVVAGIILVMAKDRWASSALENALSKITGFQTTVSGVRVDLAQARVEIEQLQIHNPSGYTSPLFVDAKNIRLETSSWAAFLSLRPEWKKISGVLSGIYLERRKDGTLNLRELALVSPPVVDRLKSGTAPAEYGRIERLELDYGKVRFREVSSDDKVTDSEIDFQGRKDVLGNITHPEVIFYAGMAKILGALNRGSLGLPRAALQQAILKSTGNDARAVQSQAAENIQPANPAEKIPV